MIFLTSNESGASEAVILTVFLIRYYGAERPNDPTRWVVNIFKASRCSNRRRQHEVGFLSFNKNDINYIPSQAARYTVAMYFRCRFPTPK